MDEWKNKLDASIGRERRLERKITLYDFPSTVKKSFVLHRTCCEILINQNQGLFNIENENEIFNNINASLEGTITNILYLPYTYFKTGMKWKNYFLRDSANFTKFAGN